ncbi:hypothetical protein LTR39_005686 [Cryomyces antarcticus]|nr:hypothetical protein LTR39_005686 [Cryomyces antarcticus]
MYSMNYANSSTSSAGAGTSSAWQERLQEHCRATHMRPPIWNIVSDRRGKPRLSPSAFVPKHNTPRVIPSYTTLPHRTSPTVPTPTTTDALTSLGGRTAWSSTVMVQGQYIPARYWYDGQYVNNAKEDAAEVALQKLGQAPAPSGPFQQQQRQRYYSGACN